MNIRLSNGRVIPVETHKVRVVQEAKLPPIRRRLQCIGEAGYNTFLLWTRDIFLDMLTDSGTNAMSDNQQAAMMVSDDAYAGSESFLRLASAVKDVLGFTYTMPVHQGRAAEHLLAKVFVKQGDVVVTNYHFTTTRAHIELAGATLLELFGPEGLNTAGSFPFRGNLDLQRLKDAIQKHGREKISYVRMEATTNLIGGQPFSIENLRAVRAVCTEQNILLVYDGSLISENAYFIKMREPGYADKSIQEIIHEMMSMVDIFYLSARKSCCVRGGLIAMNNKDYYDKLLAWLPVYEGFATYGGMSTKEIEAMAVGIREFTDISVAGQTPEFIAYFVNRLLEEGVPAVTPPGGLACHVDARRFVPHIPVEQYQAGALAAAIYIASGTRSMERGTVSVDRDPHTGKELYADIELARMALPRRVYTMSHIEYMVDRLSWLYKNRSLIGGLKFTFEPPVLRFFFGRMEPLADWGSKLAQAFEAEFGPDL